MSSSADRVYIDVLNSSDPNDRYATYFKRFGQNIVDNPSDYYLTFDRFKIPCDNIPILIFKPNTYIVTLVYNGVSSGPFYVEYIPSYLNKDDNDSKYYYVFSFDIMLKMINLAIAKAHTHLGTLTSIPVGSVPPFFQLDKNTNLMQLYAQIAYYDLDPTIPPTPAPPAKITGPVIPANTFQLYFNRQLYKYFYGMPVYYDATSNVMNAMFNIYNTGSNITGLYYVMTTNKGTSTITNWNVCQGLVMMSDYINAEQEDLPVKSDTALLNKRNVLANFDLIYDESHPTPDTAQYILQSVYKLISLHGRNFDTIDLKVYWSDSNNQLYPLDFNFEKTFSVRFVLIRKGTEKQ